MKREPHGIFGIQLRKAEPVTLIVWMERESQALDPHLSSQRPPQGN